jgi:hypothetical protein
LSVFLFLLPLHCINSQHGLQSTVEYTEATTSSNNQS